MTPTIAPRFRTLLLLFLAIAGTLLAGAAPASAHAALTGSDPKQGSVVAQAPARISLTFSEQVSMNGSSLRVLDPQGKRVDTGAPTDLGGSTYAVNLHAGLPDGTFTVTYQVVSADSHPVSGAFTFSIGAPSQTSVVASGQEVGGGAVGFLYGAGRYFSYAGFILLVGGAAFVLGCWQRGSGVRPVQRLVVAGWLTLTVSTLALLLLRGSYVGSGKVGDIFDLGLLGQVLQTKSGAALVSRLLLLAAAALFIAVLFGAYAKRDEDARAAAEALAVATRNANKKAKGTKGGRAKGAAGNAGGTKTVAAKAGGAKAVSAQADGGTKAVTARADGGQPDPAKAGAGKSASRATAPDVPENPDASATVEADGTDDAPDLATQAADLATEKKDLTFGLAIGGVVVAAGLAASWAMAEHASTGVQAGIAMPIDVLHLLAVAGWLGGLTALLVSLFRAPAEAQIDAAGVRRFSRLAFASVLVLVATGVYQSWRQLGSWSALTDTTYGRLLLVKIGLVAVLVGVASVSRRWTGRIADEVPKTAKATKAALVEQRSARRTPATVPADSRRAAQLARQQAAVDTARAQRVRDADPNRTALRRSVLAEAGVAVVLLAVTTALTTTEPGRTEEAVQQARSASAQRSGPLSLKIPFDTGGEDGKGTAEVTFDPARVGGNEMHVFVVRPNGKAFDVPEVKLALTLKAKDVGPLPVTPDRIATGHWSASDVQIPMAGDWKIAVTVRTSDIDQVTVNKNAQIG
ncbi:copper resistance protein CopC [Streptomyces sp. NPDC007084]|uniref:copper resistance CopC/CopD family protein n=1 Tax=Streptomyces sp. NPDC007084 TaxID=3154313 RepID=UPI003454D3B9